MKFYNFINEKKFIATIRDLQRLENKALTRDQEFNINFLLDYWYDGNKKAVQEILQTFSKAVNMALEVLKKKSGAENMYIEKKQTLNQFLDSDEFPEKPKDYFPIIVYVSAFPDDQNTIGLLVHQNGKIEEFEGNEEAHYQTTELIDDILGYSQVKVTVYGNHNVSLVRKIEDTKTLPADLYVSPIKSYAEGYWSTAEERMMFSCEAVKANFYRESEYDWKTKKDTKINKFRYV